MMRGEQEGNGMLGKKVILLGALLAALGGTQAGVASDKPEDGAVMRFHVNVRVDVDAAGKPTLVEMPEGYPAPVRDFVTRRVASWQYLPASRDGVPQSATTYVRVDACAVPVEGGYRLDVDFDGNGPRAAGGQPLPSPRYPHEADMRGVEAELTVIVNIDGQGHASFERFENEAFHGGNTRINAGTRKAFETELRQWVQTLRFDPERVAGQPVPKSEVSIPVLFSQSGGRAEWEARQAEAKASNACRLASGSPPALEPVALNPAVKVTPRPAGDG